jgi:transcriptional regulator with XRE-family HTH domain
MGRRRRAQPKKLKAKLKQIRERLDLTQEEMVKALRRRAPREFLHSGYIAQFENGKREPSLPVLLAYSKLADVSINYLVDDKLRLPDIGS